MKIAREDGVALLVTLVMLLVVSLLAASLMFSAQSETWSSMNYRLMTQAKYGAEAGIHRAANYMLNTNTYVAPSTGGADPIGAYTLTTSPVQYNGQPVVLSSEPSVAANYPVAAVSTAFRNAVTGSFTTGNSVVTYTASATLISMEEITVYGSATPATVQTWTVTGYGAIAGARDARIEVSTVIERQPVPMFQYTAFATDPNCGAMQFQGTSGTGSYDSAAVVWSGGSVVTQAAGGNVGTNGNLAESGSATINGTLYTPRSGVGKCSAGNVTPLSASGGARVTGGVYQLPQTVTYPTPDLPNPLPPTNTYNINSNTTLAPGEYGNIRVTAGAAVHLQAGHYSINSIDLVGGSTIVIDSGPVVVDIVAGPNDSRNPASDFTGGRIVNGTMDSSQFQIRYAGANTIKFAGGPESALVVYAPNANAELHGEQNYYGAFIAKTLVNTGNGGLYYDRQLQNEFLTLGNFLTSGFTWKKF